MIKNLLTKKTKGYVVTLEMMSALIIWTALMSATVYVINNQRWQKLMYTSFCSAATQTAKWGGTDTNIMHANGRNEDIATSMEDRINAFYPGVNVEINITPAKVTSPDQNINITLTWTPINNSWGGIFSAGVGSRSPHTISGTFNPIAKPGKLL